MSPLEMVLWFKIVATLLLWALPLLLIPTSLQKKWKLIAIEPPLFGRLLGLAYLALVVGYSSGIMTLRNGQWPTAIIWMGLVSNGGALLLLLFSGIRGDWSSEAKPTKALLWLSAAVLAIITTGLVVYGLVEGPVWY